MAREENLSHLVCLITGAGRGIGRAIAFALASRGASLAIVNRTASRLDDVAGELTAPADSVLTLPADVSLEGDVERAVSATMDRYGRLDVLINNAGLRPVSVTGPLRETSVSDFDRVVAVNLRGAYLFMKAVIPIMVQQGQGDIINIGSVAALHAHSPGNMAYRATKFGLRAMSSTLTHEVAQDGVRVTQINPGNVLTDLQQFRIDRGEDPTIWLQPEDIADTVVFILGLERRVLIPEITIVPAKEP